MVELNNSIIKTKKLKKRYYDNTYAVNSIDLEIKESKITGFLGPNGAGKSTTIKMLLGLLEPTEGEIYVFNKRLTPDNPRIRKDIGYMPELPKFPNYLTGQELLRIYGELQFIPEKQLNKEIPELLEEVNLYKDKDRKIKEYSKGMQQRIGLAAAFLGNPRLIILDEPTIGLDPVGMVDIKNIIKRKAKEGTTVFLSSHLLKEVEEMCDDVIIINKGTILASGSTDEVIKKGTGKNVLEIEVDDKSIDKIANVLKNLPYVGELNISNSIISLTLNTKEDVRYTISKLIVENGGFVLMMKYKNVSLEEAFLKILSG
jgi:ABC-2 type transport system ATP-binding protein